MEFPTQQVPGFVKMNMIDWFKMFPTLNIIVLNRELTHGLKCYSFFAGQLWGTVDIWPDAGLYSRSAKEWTMAVHIIVEKVLNSRIIWASLILMNLSHPSPHWEVGHLKALGQCPVSVHSCLQALSWNMIWRLRSLLCGSKDWETSYPLQSATLTSQTTDTVQSALTVSQ